MSTETQAQGRPNPTTFSRTVVFYTKDAGLSPAVVTSGLLGDLNDVFTDLVGIEGEFRMDTVASEQPGGASVTILHLAYNGSWMDLKDRGDAVAELIGDVTGKRCLVYVQELGEPGVQYLGKAAGDPIYSAQARGNS